MLSRLAVVAVIGAGFIGAPNSSSEQVMIGEWKGDTYIAGTVGTLTLNLFPNGTYSRLVSTSSEFGWTMEGDMLMMAPVAGVVAGEITYGKVSAVKLRFDDDSL